MEDIMAIDGMERARRSDLEVLHRITKELDKGIEVEEKTEIRERAIAEFIKRLDGKLANMQDGESLIVDIRIDIVRPNGKVRGGSGSQRNMPEYMEWRKAVFARDNYVCQECGSNKHIQAHHVLGWQNHPTLRFDVTNGVTLCFDCHAQKHPHIGWMKAR
jgi:hypothetical protein